MRILLSVLVSCLLLLVSTAASAEAPCEKLMESPDRQLWLELEQLNFDNDGGSTALRGLTRLLLDYPDVSIARMENILRQLRSPVYLLAVSADHAPEGFRPVKWTKEGYILKSYYLLIANEEFFKDPTSLQIYDIQLNRNLSLLHEHTGVLLPSLN